MSKFQYFGNKSDLEDAFKRAGFIKCDTSESITFQFKTKKKSTINYFESTNNISVQNGNAEDLSIIKDIIINLDPDSIEEETAKESKIFIVHGDDIKVKESIELMLYKWGLKPYAIEDVDSKGGNIIKFLEHEINNKNTTIAIVLLTSDDTGYANNVGEEHRSSRARERVFFKLGALLAKFGRERVIIIKESSVERFSNIEGLIYISYDKDKINQISEKLKNIIDGLINTLIN